MQPRYANLETVYYALHSMSREGFVRRVVEKESLPKPKVEASSQKKRSNLRPIWILC
jgi:DNA-binding PadR family transcriptional regulator